MITACSPGLSTIVWLRWVKETLLQDISLVSGVRFPQGRRALIEGSCKPCNAAAVSLEQWQKARREDPFQGAREGLARRRIGCPPRSSEHELSDCRRIRARLDQHVESAGPFCVGALGLDFAEEHDLRRAAFMFGYTGASCLGTVVSVLDRPPRTRPRPVNWRLRSFP